MVLAASVGSSVLAQGKGKGKGTNQATSASLTLNLVNDADGDGVVSYGDTINFTVQQTETNMPYVSLMCYQGGTLVASSITWPDPTTLYSRAWQSGAADCVAELFYFSSPKKVVLATLSFPVAE